MNLGQGHDTPLGNVRVIHVYSDPTCQTIYGRDTDFCYVHTVLQYLGIMTLGQGHNTPLGYGQQLCEIKNCCSEELWPGHWFWVCSLTLTLEIIPWGQGMTIPWAMDNNCIKYPDQTWQTPDKVIPMYRYASQATQKGILQCAFRITFNTIWQGFIYDLIWQNLLSPSFWPCPIPMAWDVSEVWATFIWSYSPCLVNVWPPKLEMLHFVKWDEITDRQMNRQLDSLMPLVDILG